MDKNKSIAITKTTQPRRQRFTTKETVDLVNLWAEPEMQLEFKTNYRNSHLWKKLSLEMTKLSYQCTAVQCKNKIQNLISDYRTSLPNNPDQQFAFQIIANVLARDDDTRGVNTKDLSPEVVLTEGSCLIKLESQTNDLPTMESKLKFGPTDNEVDDFIGQIEALNKLHSIVSEDDFTADPIWPQTDDVLFSGQSQTTTSPKRRRVECVSKATQTLGMANQDQMKKDIEKILTNQMKMDEKWLIFEKERTENNKKMATLLLQFLKQ